MKKIIQYFLIFLLTVHSLHAQTYEATFTSLTGTQFNGEVNAIGTDNNGKIIVGGDFTSFNGTARDYLARLNSDGTLDAGYDPSANISSSISSLTVHSDDAVTIVTAGALKRFDINGTQFSGATFTPASVNNVINTVAAESTGHGVIIGGHFTDVGNRIARLNADGSLDATFATNIGSGFNNTVRTIEVTSTGKILVGGDFTSFNGVARYKIALLNSDGTLDTSFDPGTTLISDVQGVYAVAMQADGKVLAGSAPSGFTRVVRFNTDGSTDGGFIGTISNPTSLVRDIFTNGTEDIIVGGWFNKGIAKLDYTTGSLITIVAGNGIEGSFNEINAVGVQSNEAVIIGGGFTTYNGFSVNNFSILEDCHISIDTQPMNASTCENDDASFTVSGSGGSQFQWQVNSSLGLGAFTDLSDGGDYAGATTATLTVSNITTSMNNNRYRCVVSDTDASAPTDCFRASQSAILTVNTLQILTADPIDEEVCDGGSASFSIDFTGTSGGFQWQEDPGTGVFSDLISGGKYVNVNHSTLTISGASKDMDGYKYRLVSTLCQSEYTSASAMLTVNSIPVITESGQQRPKVCVSGDASFTVDAVGNALTYQWQYRPVGAPNGSFTDLPDGGEVSGATTSLLNLTGVDNTFDRAYLTESDGRVYAQFRCKVTTNGCDAYTSEVRLLEIHPTPVITVQPVSPTPLCHTSGAGVNTSFSLQRTIGAVQWQVNDGNGYVDLENDAVYTGATSNFLSLTGVTTAFNGYTYRAIIGTCSPEVISDEVLLTISERPVITQHPITANVCNGGDAEFTVTATGSNLTYQWQESISGIFIDIVNNATYFAFEGTLQITGAGLALNNRSYRCVVSSGDGCSVNSGTPVLRVFTEPTFSGTIQDRIACDGGDVVTFSKSAQNFNTLVHSYQWQEAFVGSDIFVDISDGAKFSGTTGTTLSVLAPTVSMSGNRYRLKVNGCVSDIVSDDALLTVKRLPIITASPEPQTVCFGEPISFSVTAVGDTDMTYQWLVSTDGGINFGTLSGFSGINTATISLGGVGNTQMDGWVFKCKVSAASPCQNLSAESFEAMLSVNEVTIISISPSDQICSGEDATFTIEAQGKSLTYQWMENGSPLTDGGVYSGTTTASLTVTDAPVGFGSKNYSCMVGGLCEAKTQTVGNLNVTDVPQKPEIIANLSNSNGPMLHVTNVSASLEWFLDGNFYGTGNSIIVSTSGNYTVIGSQGSCTGEESDPYFYKPLGLDDTNEFQVYPNPALEYLTVNSEKDLGVRIISMDGRMSMEGMISKSRSLDIRSLKAGQYIIQLVEEGNLTHTGKIIKIN